jgi:ribonuclease BN (tRNA processing enzyme)
MGLSFTVLGSSGTYSGPGNACTGFLVRAGRTTVLMDAGPGTFANLQRHIDPAQLDAIVISHSHPDHWLDLPVMRNALRYVLGVEGLDLYTTSETLGLAESVSSGGMGSTFCPHAITDGSELTIGDMGFRFSRTDHPVETLAMRVEHDGRSFAFSADTGPGWSFEEFGVDLDLALSEATYLEGSEHGKDEKPVHLTAAQAGASARRAAAGRLVISHVLPTGSVADAVVEASDAYGAPVEVAEVHRTFTV